MGNLNKAMLIGRLGADPDVRYTQSNTAVATISLATSERYKDANGELQESTEWHRVVAWGRLAEIVQQYARKGSQIYVEGPIQTRAWEDRDGQKRYTTEIKALTIQLLDSRSEGSSGTGTSSGRGTEPAATTPSDAPDFSGGDDDDLPF
ncbi:MAG: single-strand DNA-binding protein Ssb [Bacteroidetes bacterium HLUCCA01]|nr:MAG: single-strand DNA-binding protein Ssb [Bacteroidetes bacterium HLUCCA01]